MPRKLRIWHPGETYHVTARGNRKELIYYDRKDYEKYLKLLIRVKNEVPFNLHAYCLMPNHVHLLIEMIQEPISQVIKKIHTSYAIYFNKRHDLIGHVFQDRFHSTIVHSPEYLLEVTRYIHMNPVEAKMVKKPEDFLWSSYQDYVKQKPFDSQTENKDEKTDSSTSAFNSNKLQISTQKVLSHFPKPRIKHFREFVETPKEAESMQSE